MLSQVFFRAYLSDFPLSAISQRPNPRIRKPMNPTMAKPTPYSKPSRNDPPNAKTNAPNNPKVELIFFTERVYVLTLLKRFFCL